MMINPIQKGTLGTIAGSGEPGFAGDGEDACSACLNEPKNIGLDPWGHLYIADSENHVIRRVDRNTGIITTVAGCPHNGAGRPPLALGPTDSSLWEKELADPLADSDNLNIPAYTQSSDISGMVRYVVGQGPGSKQFGGDGEPASRAALNFPSAVVVDTHGNLYIADTLNHRVRQVDGTTGIISTIAGTGQAKFSGDGGPAISAALNEPVALALEQDRYLYIADQSNNRVRKIDLETGTISTIAGNGNPAFTGDGRPAQEAGLAGPSGLALDQEGNVYIADTFSGRVRRVEKTTETIQTVLGDGGVFQYQPGVNESSTSLSRPYGIAVDPNGDLLITDSDNHLIRKWDHRTKEMTRVAGTGLANFSGDGQDPRFGSLNFPFGVAVDHQGRIYIADTFNHRIRMIAV